MKGQFYFVLLHCKIVSTNYRKNDNTAIEEMWLTNNPRVELWTEFIGVRSYPKINVVLVTFKWIGVMKILRALTTTLSFGSGNSSCCKSSVTWHSCWATANRLLSEFVVNFQPLKNEQIHRNEYNVHTCTCSSHYMFWDSTFT